MRIPGKGVIEVAWLALASLSSAFAPASTTLASEWKPYGLQGMTVRSLAATEELLCAGTQGAGVFCRQLDGMGTGSGWLANGLAGVTVTWLWIDMENPLVRLAASAAGPSNSPSLYRTINGGQTWLPADGFPSPGGRAYAVHGVPGTGTIFAAGPKIWVSHDLGQMWSVSSMDGGLDCLEISRANPRSVWSGGETLIFMGFTVRSLDGGASWATVWDSRQTGDNQTSDVAAHPLIAGLVLTGHEGFVLRTVNDGGAFSQVLDAPSRFFLDWDGGNPQRAYGAGSPNGGTCHAFVSRNLGLHWTDVTGTVLAPRTVFRIEGDEKRTGVVYAATDDGVYRYYGGGLALCLDGRSGIDSLRFTRTLCPPPSSPEAERKAPLVVGDVIAVDPANFFEGDATLFLGEAECLADDVDLSLVTLDTPDPAPGRTLAILARLQNQDYGFTSAGLIRNPTSGDCP